MKLTFVSTSLAFLQFLPAVLAQTACTQSSAQKYDDPNDGCSQTALDRDDTGCVQQFCTQGGTQASLAACFCLASGSSNCARDIVPDTLSKRQAFTCTSSEKCYINPVDNGLFCLDASTGDYHGESGDSGNVNTGSYTPASGGGATSATNTAAPSSTARSSTSRSVAVGASSAISAASSRASAASTSIAVGASSATSAASSRASAASTSTTGAGASVTSSRSGSGTGSASVASATSSAFGARDTAGAAVGILGLLVGLAL